MGLDSTREARAAWWALAPSLPCLGCGHPPAPRRRRRARRRRAALPGAGLHRRSWPPGSARARSSLIDVRTDVFTYLRGHLPGAVYLNTETLRASEAGMPTQLLTAGAYAALFSRLGLTFDRPVVIYSAGETAQHRRDVSRLAAGRLRPSAGLRAGRRLLQVAAGAPAGGAAVSPDCAETAFPVRAFRPERASLEDVRRALATGDAVLVDARPPDQYAGEAGAQMRRGHIPGRDQPLLAGRSDPGGLRPRLEAAAELRAGYAAQGITPDKDIIAYCNSATEASHVHFTLRYLLGYPRVRIYVGSWTEWAEREDCRWRWAACGRA